MEQSMQALSPITIQQIIIFIQVVESNGFAKASSILHMTQSAVSKSVAKLEKELELPLFIRTTREIHLTDAGRHLYEEWKRHLHAIQSSYVKALDIYKQSNSLLRVGLLNTARPDRYFWEIQKRFMEKNPGITIELKTEYMTDLIENLTLNLYDVIMIPDFERYSLEERNLSWKWAAKSNARIFVSCKNPLASKEKVRMEDIIDATFVSLGRSQSSNFSKDLKERFAPYGSEPRFETEYDSAYSIQYLFQPVENLLLADDYFDYPDYLNLRSVPVENQFNGIICGYDLNNENPNIAAFLKALPKYKT